MTTTLSPVAEKRRQIAMWLILILAPLGAGLSVLQLRSLVNVQDAAVAASAQRAIANGLLNGAVTFDAGAAGAARGNGGGGRPGALGRNGGGSGFAGRLGASGSGDTETASGPITTTPQFAQLDPFAGRGNGGTGGTAGGSSGGGGGASGSGSLGGLPPSGGGGATFTPPTDPSTPTPNPNPNPTPSPVSPLPEPEAWVLMIAGSAMSSWWLRRRSRTAKAA